MTQSVSLQLTQFVNSILLGFAVGILYDLLRALRARRASAFLTALLDILFWLLAAGALFGFAMQVGFGELRIFMAAGAAGGGVIYFCSMSRFFFRFFVFGVDLLVKFLKIVLFPIHMLKILLKKGAENAKNIFLYYRKWYKIMRHERTRSSSRDHRPKSGRDGAVREDQKGKPYHKDRYPGGIDLRGHIASQSPGSDTKRRRGKGASGKTD
ncbi:spore cortex biosynthesis protein YabQ [Papillibacter cinnamivorans]|uniref:spore cortex biosynthesis protein YabQ n=1 Tax=Papillibacter cinnamivorans TaxID=100176 RepID=UPI0009FC0E19